MARYTPNQVFHISTKTFNDIDAWIRAAEQSGRNVRFGVNALVMLMARTNQAIAMQMSAGPVDPRAKNVEAAWKIPVRRITQHYYRGWKVRRLAPGAWLLYNDSREAYFIEFGINHVGEGFEVQYRDGRRYIKSSRRVRRPIRKLSLIRTLREMDRTRAGERVWEMVFGGFRPGRRHTRRGAVISDQVQAMPGMRFL